MMIINSTLLKRGIGNRYTIRSNCTKRNALSLNISKLSVHKKEGPPTPIPDLTKIPFGSFFSDHILEIDWEKGRGWNNPIIKPLESLSIHPSASSLHYALQCFEGMKVYKGDDNAIRMFRPELNIIRLRRSCERLVFPDFNGDDLLYLLKKFLTIDSHFVPKGNGYSMYIRPTVISTTPNLSVAVPTSVKLYVLLSPVGPYFAESDTLTPVSLYASTDNFRCWPGGGGSYKIGSNYAPTIMPLSKVKPKFNELLWLFPDCTDCGYEDYFITEAGTMNIFVVLKNRNGIVELVTCPLRHDLILPGTTRKSIIQMARVTEKKLYMRRDLIPAAREGRLLEMFGVGTACGIQPVESFYFNGETFKLPIHPHSQYNSYDSGIIAKELYKRLTDIQYGRVKSNWSSIIHTDTHTHTHTHSNYY
eukprot:GHVR01124317.1.p1 GENE.GHVR01124317.1~~GHVR01124317.1.p1  ORF type:complete len:418 (+),score=54.79 GHVR01124317.1:29-1282(+)